LFLFFVFLVEMWLIFTIQERQKAALTLARDKAEEADQSKSEFLSTMSHEIRTPLNAVIGLTSLLDETPLNEEQQDFVSTVKMSGESLLTVINDILDYSKMEAGKLELEEEVFSLREAVEDVLELVAHKAHEKSLELLSWVEDDCAGGARGDVTRLRQILLNLLSNAIKFTDQGEVMVSVRWEEKNDQGEKRLLFSVRDTGIGIPQDRLHRLFQSFSQVDASTTRKYGGTGLGLAISKRLVDMMGGEIWAESEEQVGTSFHFSLPLTPEVWKTAIDPQQPALIGKKVLLLDDHALNLEMLTRTLNKWGLECVAFQTADQALEFLAGQKVDLVITDLCMPEMNGVDFVRALRTLPGTKPGEPPIILLSSSGRQLEEADRASFVALLSKPVRDTQLFRAISKAMGKGEAALPKEVPPQVESKTPEQPTPKKLRILLTEDNAVNQKVATKMLKKLGYQADSAWNGEEAVTACKRMDYDLILMDMNMPVMDGIEATKHIQALLKTEGRPLPIIVAMTANVMMEHRETCLKAGMNDFLGKPVKLAGLEAMIQSWFDESSLAAR
jgi:CheY-like chemotaxis protein/nitrogen-specific signal transduction histidine kinase